MPEIPPAEEISQVDESIATLLDPPPIETVPVDVPVPMLTALLDDAFKLIVPPVVVNPALPVIRPEEVKVPAPVRLAPEAVSDVVPPEARTIFPVLVSPRVSDCLAVVAILPAAFMYKPPVVPAESEAVGVPPAMLVTANRALEVAVAPRSRSSVILTGVIAPAFSCQY